MTRTDKAMRWSVWIGAARVIAGCTTEFSPRDEPCEAYASFEEKGAIFLFRFFVQVFCSGFLFRFFVQGAGMGLR